MGVRTRVRELKAATGGPRTFARKLKRAGTTARRMLDRSEREVRIARLQKHGIVGDAPNDWQLVQGAWHMMFGYILPSNEEFYEHYEQGHWWHQLMRVLEEPATMMDPIGFGLEQQTLLTHLVEVVHASAGYDVALLFMWDDGITRLRDQLQQVVDGTHPRQARIEALLEHPDYPARLLQALDHYEADPAANWRVHTVPAPEGCDALFDWGIDTFGSPGRLFEYCHTLPPTVGSSVKAWVAGELRLPTPASSSPATA